MSLGDDGEIDGYVYYYQKNRSDGFDYWLDVRDIIAENPQAARALWRLLGSSATQAEHVRYPGAQNHALLFQLPDQQREGVGQIAWMLRLVDAPGAIRERGFPAGLAARVELELSDDTCAWNAGRFVLEVADGRGQLEKGGSGALRLSTGALASLYTGFASTHTLAGVGMLEGGEADSRAALDAAFAGPAPVLLDEF